MSPTFQDLLLELEQAEGDKEKSDPIMEQLQLRIDEVKEHQDELKSEAAGLRAEADMKQKLSVAPLYDRAAAIENNAKAILDRLLYFMEQRGFEKLPGNVWRLDVRENNPSVIGFGDRGPNAELFHEFPQFIRRIEPKYELDKKAIAVHLKNGKELSFAKFDVIKKRLEFEVKK